MIMKWSSFDDNGRDCRFIRQFVSIFCGGERQDPAHGNCRVVFSGDGDGVGVGTAAQLTFTVVLPVTFGLAITRMAFLR